MSDNKSSSSNVYSTGNADSGVGDQAGNEGNSPSLSDIMSAITKASVSTDEKLEALRIEISSERAKFTAFEAKAVEWAYLTLPCHTSHIIHRIKVYCENPYPKISNCANRLVPWRGPSEAIYEYLLSPH